MVKITDPKEIAIWGGGRMGMIHASALRYLFAEAKITVIETRHTHSSQWDALDVNWVQCADSVLDNGADVVYNCLPTDLHYETSKRVLFAGIPLFIEKPLAVLPTHAQELLRLSLQMGVPLMGGYIERFNPAVLQLKRVLSMRHPIAKIQFYRVNRPPTIQPAYGAAIDLAVHDLDLLHFLTGQMPINAQIHHLEYFAHSSIESMMEASLQCSSLEVQLQVGWSSHAMGRWIRVEGDGYMFFCDTQKRKLLGGHCADSLQLLWEEPPLQSTDMATLQAQAFMQLIAKYADCSLDALNAQVCGISIVDALVHSVKQSQIELIYDQEFVDSPLILAK
jgi:predicted dehydrogenase